jgi:hypothetical protein
MRYFIYGLTLAALPLLAACEQTVPDAARDVREAEENAADRLAREQRDVQDAAKQGADAVIQEQREVEDAARAEQEKIQQEKRDLEDAARRDANPPSSP